MLPILLLGCLDTSLDFANPADSRASGDKGRSGEVAPGDVNVGDDTPDKELDVKDKPDLPPDPDEYSPDYCLTACGNGKCEEECEETADTCADCCTCGDGLCQRDPPCNEKAKFCPDDCCVCGDGQCDDMDCGEYWFGEMLTCASDCATCGEGTCDPGEGPANCPLDCCGGCGDGICRGVQCDETPELCPQDCETFACGNGVCEPVESPLTCVQDCEKFACGNQACDPGEDAAACPGDCNAACGDCVCDGSEAFDTCPVDCGFCGDGYCIGNCDYIWEDAETCPQDCCDPDCAGKDCGDDGCGGSCGECQEGEECSADFKCAPAS